MFQAGLPIIGSLYSDIDELVPDYGFELRHADVQVAVVFHLSVNALQTLSLYKTLGHNKENTHGLRR